MELKAHFPNQITMAPPLYIYINIVSSSCFSRAETDWSNINPQAVWADIHAVTAVSSFASLRFANITDFRALSTGSATMTQALDGYSVTPRLVAGARTTVLHKILASMQCTHEANLKYFGELCLNK